MSQNLPNMLQDTISKIREMVDVNNVIGDPITTPDGDHYSRVQGQCRIWRWWF